MRQVIYSALARADIRHIWQAIAEDNGEALADKKVEYIERRTAMLSRHPHMGIARPEIAKETRSLLVERWLVLYQVNTDAVRIMRVVDGVRDIKRINFDETKG